MDSEYGPPRNLLFHDVRLVDIVYVGNVLHVLVDVDRLDKGFGKVHRVEQDDESLGQVDNHLLVSEVLYEELQEGRIS